jgi:hypothetical protein
MASFPGSIFDQMTLPVAGSPRAAPTSPSALFTQLSQELTALETAFGVNFATFAALALEFSNKRIDSRVWQQNTPGATPMSTVNLNSFDVFSFTGISTGITSMTPLSNASSKLGDVWVFFFTDNGTQQTIQWGADYTSTESALPSSTKGGSTLRLMVIGTWNPATSLIECVGVS